MDTNPYSIAVISAFAGALAYIIASAVIFIVSRNSK